MEIITCSSIMVLNPNGLNEKHESDVTESCPTLQLHGL